MWNTIAKFAWIVVLYIRGSIDTPTIKKLTRSIIPQYKITTLMENFSQMAINHLTHIILNKINLGKKNPPDTTKLQHTNPSHKTNNTTHLQSTLYKC